MTYFLKHLLKYGWYGFAVYKDMFNYLLMQVSANQTTSYMWVRVRVRPKKTAKLIERVRDHCKCHSLV